MPWVSDISIASKGYFDYSPGPTFDPSINTHYTWVNEAPTGSVANAQATPVSPTMDPKLDANALYGKPMALYTGGYARMGASPAPIVGPFIDNGAGTASFIVSFGVPSNPEGDRKIYNIWLDNELAWTSPGGGTLPGHGTFTAEPFDFIFKPGTLTQTACSLETANYPGDENAYRPQMLLQILDIAYARFMEITGKPIPYVAVDIGDVSDGADPHDGINLGEALERIAFSPWCGYDSTSFDAVNITDVVDAILIKNNFTMVQLCQSVTGEYRNLDLLVSDKVRITDRGGTLTPDFIFDRNSILAGDEALSVARGNATGQRREHELITIDPDQDYTAVPSLAKIPRNPMIISAAVGKETATLPLVIDASTRQALATFSQNYEENARRKVSLKVPAFGYEIEPGDLFALTDIADGFDAEVFKCIGTTHGANWVVDIEGEAILKCSVYGETILIPATWDPTTVSNFTLSGGDLIATNTGTTTTDQGVRVASSAGKTSGKHYCEIEFTSVPAAGANCGIGIGTPASTYTNMGNSAITGCMLYRASAQVWSNGSNSGVSLTLLTYDKIGVAVDLDHRKIWFKKLSGTPGNWNGNASYDPASNIGGVTIPAGTMVPFCTVGGTATIASINHITANFGGSTFAGTVPTGFAPGWSLV